jgi:hypothetical protein
VKKLIVLILFGVQFLIRNVHLSLSNRSEGILARSFFD